MYEKILDILYSISQEEIINIRLSDDYDYISSIEKGELILILIKLMKELS